MRSLISTQGRVLFGNSKGTIWVPFDHGLVTAVLRFNVMKVAVRKEVTTGKTKTNLRQPTCEHGRPRRV